MHSVVFGGFAANELATRIDDAKPKVRSHPREDRAGCGLQVGDHRRQTAEDALGQGPPRHLKKIADGKPWTMPATIDDPAILDEIGSVLKSKGVVA